MKRIVLLIILSTMFFNSFATHNRAGEIIYKQIGPLTYEVTILTYTKVSEAAADRCELTINWGDGNSSILPRSNGPVDPNTGCPHYGVMVSNDIKVNIYIGTHTYPANGTYTVSMLDPNRNAGVLNIPNSVNEQFYIQSIILIGTGLGSNTSPVLLNPPTDFGCVNKTYLHNVAAFDVDGDSLSFELVNCRGNEGREIETTYSEKYNMDKIEVDHEGTIIWDAPIFEGVYNVALEITEHRKDPISGEWVTIGRILRDMQIDVITCNNDPPLIDVESNHCVLADSTLTFDINANDPDGDEIGLSAVGGPLRIDPKAVFNEVIVSNPPVNSTLEWTTTKDLARRVPYQVIFKSNDFPVDPDGDPLPGLASQKVVNIRVLAPGVDNLQSAISSGLPSFDLTWDKTTVPNAKGYKIYRKRNDSTYVKGVCEGGLASDSGFELIKTIEDTDITSFVDDNNGEYFITGVTYCYRVTTILFDNYESIPSKATCIYLNKVLPSFTNIDINTTSASIGDLEVIWSKPSDLDQNLYPGPYIYKLNRAEGIDSDNYTEITSFFSLDDTVFTDNNLNTFEKIYKYQIIFYNNTSGNLTEIGKSNTATSSFLNITPGNRKLLLGIENDVPWTIDSIYYYKEIDQSLTFEYIGKTNGESLIVDNLENGKEYCFKATTYGSYSTPGYKTPFVNKTQISCQTPEIITLSCTPTLDITTNCIEDSHILDWSLDFESCNSEISGYYLYFSDNNEIFNIVDTIKSTEINTYLIDQNRFKKGFFKISAYDKLDNRSNLSDFVCFQPCVDLQLPNIFTPNNDGKNDVFKPVSNLGGDCNVGTNFNVDNFHIDIFDRYGLKVFETDDTKIDWDGNNMMNKPCAEGVYYYVCTFEKLDENGQIIEGKFKGFVHLIR
jgi:gliding motility-associated-like protein